MKESVARAIISDLARLAYIAIPVPLMDRLLTVVAGGLGEKSTFVPVWAASSKVGNKEVQLPGIETDC